jgi:hypothetical protein
LSYPNVPLYDGGNLADWQRRVASAINYLLNKLEYVVGTIEGAATPGQSIIDTMFPTQRTISQSDCVLKCGTAPAGDASFPVILDGTTIGTGLIAAGQTDGSLSFTDTTIPADTRFQSTCPADATLADIFMTIALSE